MAHGGYGKRRVDGRNPAAAANRRLKSIGVDRKPKTNPKSKPKSVSLKNQIRSTHRMLLRKDLPSEIKEAQEKKLAGLKKQQEMQDRLAVERKVVLRNKKVKFFERRKIERRIRRLEKQLRSCPDPAQEADAANQLAKLKEDLEYVRFFPKTEKYVPLFVAGDDPECLEKRTKLSEQIKYKIIAAAASGKDLEETGSEDDGLLDPSDDDFFLAGSSSDEADADDELTDKSAREQASSASGKAASGMSSDERNQKHVSAPALMPPPRSQNKPISGPRTFKSRDRASSSKKPFVRRADISTSSNTSSSYNSSFKTRGATESITGNSDNLSSTSDARKPKRKRRPKKKKQQA